MKSGRLGGALVALAAGLVCHQAHATTWSVNCLGPGPGGDTTLRSSNAPATTLNFGTEPGAISGSGDGAGQPDALGALLGTPDQDTEAIVVSTFGPLSAGDTVEIGGVCNQLVQIRQSGLTLTGRNGNIAVAAAPPGSAPIDGDSNQVIIDGAQRTVINNLLFGSGSSEVALSGTGFPFAQEGLLTLVNGAQVLLVNSEVANSPTRGIFAKGNVTLALQSSIVTLNGAGNADTTDNTGIFASDSAALMLGSSVPNGTSAGAHPVSVTNNTGDGIRLQQDSELTLLAGNVAGNGQKQIFLVNSSAARIDGNNDGLVNITAEPDNPDTAVALDAGSNLLVENGAFITGSTTNTGKTISAYGTATVLLQGSFLSGGQVTVEVTGGALLALAGGNNICNGTLAIGGPTPTCTLPTPYPNSDFAIEVDHVGALSDIGALPGFNFAAATDTIMGNGVLQLQSTADLGAGLVSGNPSLVWTTGAGGINVSQNSSLRFEGGVAITGTVQIFQGSNAFVNSAHSPGTPNTINGSIYCPFTNFAASHLSITPGTLTVTPTPPTLATSNATISPTGSAGPGGPNTQGTCLTF